MAFKILVIRKDYLIPEYFYASDKNYYYYTDISKGMAYPTYEAAQIVCNFIRNAYDDKSYFLYTLICTDKGEPYFPDEEQKKYPIIKKD